MKTEFDLQPEHIWREKANQFLDVIDNKNGEDGTIIREKILYPRVLDHIGDVSGKVLLDGGCGEGIIGRLAISRGANVVGCDVVQEFLKETSLRSSGKEHVILASLRHGLPFASNSFDVVCYNLVVMWLPNITEVARETERVVKPGGRVVVSLLHPWTALSSIKHGNSKKPMLILQEGMQEGVFMRTVNKTAGPYLYFHRSTKEYLSTFMGEGFYLDPDNGFDEVLAPEESDVALSKKLFPEFLILTFKKNETA